MSSELVNCPNCGEMARVPEALYGQAVRCPACKTMYVSPKPTPEGGWTVARAVKDIRGTDPDPDRADRAFNPFVPGLGLTLVGIVAFLVNSVVAYQVFTDPEGFTNRMLQGIEEARDNRKIDEETATMLLDGFKNSVPQLQVALPAFMGISALMVGGGLSMISRRFYWLAVLGSLATFVNFANLCCCVGAPLGIWSLVVLFNPDTRMLFRRTPTIPAA